jgi:Fur family ferric uptake transcriptional regulator
MMEDALHQAGLRVTKQRMAIMRAIHPGEHLDADTVAKRVKEDLGPTSTQTVYDALAACADAGLLRRVEPAGSSMLYELWAGDNHHHLVCRRCGKITDVDCFSGETPCLTPSNKAGYRIDEAEVTFWGLCPQCLTAERELAS